MRVNTVIEWRLGHNGQPKEPLLRCQGRKKGRGREMRVNTAN